MGLQGRVNELLAPLQDGVEFEWYLSDCIRVKDQHAEMVMQKLRADGRLNPHYGPRHGTRDVIRFAPVGVDEHVEIRQALQLFLLSAHTRALLDVFDPQAVKQAIDALGGDPINEMDDMYSTGASSGHQLRVLRFSRRAREVFEQVMGGE